MPISSATKSHICDLYNSGNSIREIKKIIGVSEKTISKILKAVNITIRKDNYQKININCKEVNELYDSGMSTYQLAIKYNCSDETIRKLINNIRPECERNILSEDSKNKISEASKKLWQNEEYRAAVTAGKDSEYFERLSEYGKKNYSKTLGAWVKSSEGRIKISEIVKKLWQSTEYREKQEIYFQERGDRITAASKKALNDPQKRREWINKLRKINANKENGGWISTSQKQLYYILADSDILFYEEGPDTKIGPFYVVDCIIPIQQNMKKPLVIEVNGEYWHSMPHVMLKDKQKATYINNNTEYDLLVIDELEFNNFKQIEYKLQSFGIQLQKIETTVKNITIKQIQERDAQMLYSIFHYSSTIRKGATTFGAYVNDKLVAAISYTYPLRRSSAERLNLELKEVMEISRLARKTNFICENFASWFISKTAKRLPKTIKCLLSFSDHTYGHTGTVYKAANFVEDGIIPPDYSYISIHGKYHKKTIWDRAKRMKMSESDYADKHGLIKLMGGTKTRWILKRI